MSLTPVFSDPVSYCAFNSLGEVLHLSFPLLPCLRSLGPDFHREIPSLLVFAIRFPRSQIHALSRRSAGAADRTFTILNACRKNESELSGATGCQTGLRSRFDKAYCKQRGIG